MIRMSLLSVGLVEDTASVIVVLRAEEAARLLVMEVGLMEGRAIAMEAEGVRAPRPLTHELMLQVINRLGAAVARVQIRDFKEQTFYANLVLEKEGGDELELDARPSDAIALALRSGAPIFADEGVLEKAGITEEEAGDSFVPEVEEEEEDEESDEEEGPVVH